MTKKSKNCDSVRANAKKSASTNPFDLRFNKIKHSVVNQKLQRCEYGSNPIKSKARALEVRKKTLLAEYNNKNKIAKMEIVNEKSISKEDTKANSNAEYMSELFKRKQQAAMEKQKLENLKDKLDQQWHGLKGQLLSSQTSVPEKKSQPDDYDMFLADLMVTGGQRCVRGDLLKSIEEARAMETKKINTSGQLPSNINLFKDRLQSMITNESHEQVRTLLKIMFQSFKKLKPSMFNELKKALVDVNGDKSPINNSAVLLYAHSVPDLQTGVKLKLVELMKTSSYGSFQSVIRTVYYAQLALNLLSTGGFMPELLVVIQNVLILLSGCESNDQSLFLPSYKLQKIENKKYLLLSEHELNDQDLENLNIETLVKLEAENILQEKQSSTLFLTLKSLIEKCINAFANLDAFESMFFFIKKLLITLQRVQPVCAKHVQDLLELFDVKKPNVVAMRMPAPKAEILPMLEPDFNMDGEENPNEKVKQMKRKLKREMRSAQREIKKDAEYLHNIKLQETLEKDRVRKEKVKQLIADIQNERSLYKK